MMQILEKLPGITVERCSLVDRSCTFVGHELPQSTSTRRLLAAQAKYEMARRHHPQRPGSTTPTTTRVKPVVSEAEVLNKTSYGFRPRSRDRSMVGYHTRPPVRAPKVDLEVSGNGALLKRRSFNAASTVDESAKLPEAKDALPQDPLPMPKSILKRSGSAVSSRSSRSLGVMSLDSGMARLTASLTGSKKNINTADSPIYSIAHKHVVNSIAKHYGVVGAGAKQASDLRHAAGDFTSKKSVKQNDSSAVYLPLDGSSAHEHTPPPKSVTFKLDPEVSRHEEEIRRGDQTNKKLGGARWSVSLSPRQEHSKSLRQNVTIEVPEFAIRRSNITTKPQRSRASSETTTCGAAARSSNDAVIYGEKRHNAHSSSALLRPRADGGITGVSGIHLMADPYRRYLMTRAEEEAKKFVFEANAKDRTSSRLNTDTGQAWNSDDFSRYRFMANSTSAVHPSAGAIPDHAKSIPVTAAKRQYR